MTSWTSSMRFNVAGISRCRMAPRRGRRSGPRAASMWPASLDARWPRRSPRTRRITRKRFSVAGISRCRMVGHLRLLELRDALASIWPASLDAGWSRRPTGILARTVGFNVAGISRCRMGLDHQRRRATRSYGASMWPASLDAGWHADRGGRRALHRASMWPASLDAGWVIACRRGTCPRSGFNVAGISRCRMVLELRKRGEGDCASMWPASLDAGWLGHGHRLRVLGLASMWPASLDAGWSRSPPPGPPARPCFNVAGISRCRMALEARRLRPLLRASMWPASLDAGWSRTTTRSSQRSTGFNVLPSMRVDGLPPQFEPAL